MRLLLALLASLLVVGCTPRDRELVRDVVPPAKEITCILLQAFTSSGHVDQICATADELAPLVPHLLAARAAREGHPGQPSAVMPQGAALAFSFPPPPRPVARRRCVAWVPLASLDDAGVSRDDGSAADPFFDAGGDAGEDANPDVRP